MAKSVFYNPERAKEEETIKEEKNIEAEKRANYFKALSVDKKFRKYILEEIIDFEIKTNTDLSGSLQSLITATPEQVKEIILAKSAAKTSLENVKNKIIINF